MLSELKQTQDVILRNLPAFGLYNEGGTSPTPWPVIQISFVSNPNDKFIAYYIKTGYGNNNIEVTFQSDTVFAVQLIKKRRICQWHEKQFITMIYLGNRRS